MNWESIDLQYIKIFKYYNNVILKKTLQLCNYINNIKSAIYRWITLKITKTDEFFYSIGIRHQSISTKAAEADKNMSITMTTQQLRNKIAAADTPLIAETTTTG